MNIHISKFKAKVPLNLNPKTPFRPPLSSHENQREMCLEKKKNVTQNWFPWCRSNRSLALPKIVVRLASLARDQTNRPTCDDERFGRKVEGFQVMMKLFCRKEERKMIRSMMVMVMREEAATVRKEKGKWEREWEWGFRVRKGNEKWH